MRRLMTTVVQGTFVRALFGCDFDSPSSCCGVLVVREEKKKERPCNMCIIGLPCLKRTRLFSYSSAARNEAGMSEFGMCRVDVAPGVRESDGNDEMRTFLIYSRWCLVRIFQGICLCFIADGVTGCGTPG